MIRTEVLTEHGGPPEFLIGGRNPAFARILDVIHAVAPTDSTVLIQGESGTGKDIIARLIHQRSKRRDGAWVAVDCGSIPRELMESELFGHEKGAFTGALAKKDGLCLAADGGTLFLDEIGELPLTLQVKLLRVLQSGLIRPVGSTSSVRASFRVFAATNRDLREEVKKGRFRLDLYYRLNVINITLPALRERPEDIPDLVDAIASRISERGLPNKGLSDETLAILQQHSWPGNIRELENFVRSMLLFVDGDRVELANVRQFEDFFADGQFLDAAPPFFRDYRTPTTTGDVPPLAAPAASKPDAPGVVAPGVSGPADEALERATNPEQAIASW
ncbi:MAG: sigma-54-dependent Fis family transcriptional regulator, partial [Planctomycetes bacterium]|nr:sigma-54-dependent Fis family transcriptional regulator [Planctomycetota bacterium]